MASRWLAVRVDMIIGVFIAILALSAIPLASSECGSTCALHVYSVLCEVNKSHSVRQGFYDRLLYSCMSAIVQKVHSHWTQAFLLI